MPDATHGVPVYRFSGCPKDSFVQCEPNVRWDNGVPGTWYPADEAAARDAVIAAGLVLRAANDDLMRRQEEYPDDAYIEAWVRFSSALDRLDAIRNDKEKDR